MKATCFDCQKKYIEPKGAVKNGMMVAAAGIELPRMYRLGYHNANCPDCQKGGEGYWNKIRKDFPERFDAMADLQDVLGEGSYFFQDRTTGKRISLRILSPTAGRFRDEPPMECGAVCEMPDGVATNDPEAA